MTISFVDQEIMHVQLMQNSIIQKANDMWRNSSRAMLDSNHIQTVFNPPKSTWSLLSSAFSSSPEDQLPNP